MEKSDQSKLNHQEGAWIPPVVTVMGHVDHGKTTLLDTIRHTQVASRESGGITQHIGAYRVDFQGKRITFIDTPGHEAFSAMRQRGGRFADIIILVVDATEGVKPQTLEALSYAQQSQAPIIVAINKIDLPGANSLLVKNQLAQHNLLVEGFGGSAVCVELSAKTGENIGSLLEMIILTAQIYPAKGNPTGPLEAYIIESKLDRRRGPTASIVVKSGQLSLGQEINAGAVEAKVKQILDNLGNRLTKLQPGEAGEVLGFSKVPAVGESVSVGKPTSVKVRGEEELNRSGLALEDGTLRLRLLIKADVMGSLEALKNAIGRLPSFDSQISLIFAGVGDVCDSDVNLAKASSAVIIAFRVGVPGNVEDLAESFGTEIKQYQIIYNVVDDIESAVKGLSAWQKKEGPGRAVILKVFTLGSGDNVFGCRVNQGNLTVGDLIRIRKAGSEIIEARIKNLKIGKDRVSKVSAEKECGILFNERVEAGVGDEIEIA